MVSKALDKSKNTAKVRFFDASRREDDASRREVSTQTRLSMEPHAYRMVCW